MTAGTDAMVAPRKGRFREVRNTITANSAIAATTISDPTIGAATNASPLQQHDGNAGRKQDRADQVEMDARGREPFGRAGAHALSPSL